MTDDHTDVAAVPALAGPVAAGAKANRPKWVAPAAIGLILVLIGSLVVGVWFGIKAVHGFSAERAEANAVDAAKVVATKLTTYDSGTAEADMKALLATATPLYAGALQGDQGDVIKAMRNGQARSNGTVTEAGVLSYDPTEDTAHVLVTVQAQVTNKAVPGGEAREYRLELTMVDQGDWLVDAVEFVG